MESFVDSVALLSVHSWAPKPRLRPHRDAPAESFRAKVYAGIDPLTGKRRYLAS